VADEEVIRVTRAEWIWERALAAASLTTIATGGALIGLGLRENDLSRVFRVAGRGVLERLGVVMPGLLSSVAVGYLHHLIVASVWGLLLGLVIVPWRSVARFGVAIAATVAYCVLSVTIVPAALRIGSSVTSDIIGVFSIAVPLLLALLGAAWLAFVEPWHDPEG
jgi:hypothetical protein